MMAIKRLIPNLLTAGNLTGGIFAIILSLNGRIDLAPYCIFASAIFDFLDGFVARLLKVPSEMGKQLDSLADMVTFGVAPGILCYELLKFHFFVKGPSGAWGINLIDFPINLSSYHENDWMTYQHYIPYIAFIIPVFALFRLAKFNIDTRQTDSFIGLPTPAMTLFFSVFPILIATTYEGVLAGELHITDWQFSLSQLALNPWFLIASSIVLSVLMVVELPLFALKFKHFKWKENEIRYLFLTLSVLLLATLFVWAIPLIVILYVILSLINTRIAK